MKNFEELDFWKVACEVRIFVVKIAGSLSSEEKCKFAHQIIKCSQSTLNNIAEGLERFSTNNNAQFYRIGKGLFQELINYFTVALDEEYITREQCEEIQEKIARCIQILNQDINYLLRSIPMKFQKISINQHPYFRTTNNDIQ